MKLSALIKKEFFRFFHDPRLIIAMLLPGLLIFMIYSIIGSVSTQQPKYDFKVYVAGESQAVAALQTTVEHAGYTLELLPAEDAEAARHAVEEGEATALLTFSQNFDEAVASGEGEPTVQICFNSLTEGASIFYSIADSAFTAYGMKFAITSADTAPEGALMTNVLAGLMPFLIVILIFCTSMSVTLESVAGEKERGTLSTILVTSVPRSHIALGKVIPLACITLIGAVSSFIGVALSLPKMMGFSIGAFAGGYGFLSYLFLFLLIVSVVPLLVGLISIVSTYSKSVKEASGYTSVIMIVIMVISLAAAFISGLGDWAVAVPVLNAVVIMQRILTGSVCVWQTLVTVAANLAYTALIVFGMSKMLSSERIMFGK